MQLHPRFFKVNDAKRALSEQFWNMVKKYDLTYLECVQVLAALIDDIVKYGIRTERHPDDPDKKGDEA